MPGRTPCGSAGAHRQPYGVFERGVRSNVSVRAGPLAEQFYLVSNRRGKLGAICMCYPGVLESLSQRFEASLYVIPSSIHECMVIPDYDVFPEECLSDMVRDVNEKTVKPQEILSDHVYYYHRESGELTLCEEET